MQETNANNKQSQDGWYKHKETGSIVLLEDDPTFGVPLTNSYIRARFVFVGASDPRVTPETPVEETKEVKKVK